MLCSPLRAAALPDDQLNLLKAAAELQEATHGQEGSCWDSQVIRSAVVSSFASLPAPPAFVTSAAPSPYNSNSMSRCSSSSRKVVWDEENLKENEEIQKEYSAVRIQEPKTPYRPPLPSDSLEDEMKPLQLDEVASALGPDRMTAFEYVMSNGGAAYDGAGRSQQQEQQQLSQQQEQPQLQEQEQPPPAAPSASISNASSELDGDKVMQDALGDKRSEPCTSFTSSGSEGSADKRQKFEQMRKQHYNMRDALVKAKQLLDTEDEEDAGGPGPDTDHDQEEEEEEADTANCQNCNGMAVDSADKPPAATQQHSLHSTAQQLSQQGGTSSSAQQADCT